MNNKKPLAQFLDTASGEICIEGTLFIFCQLDGTGTGFLLGVDTDSWTRNLYYDPGVSENGYYCFDPLKMMDHDHSLIFLLGEIIKKWQDNPSPKNITEILGYWKEYGPRLHNELLEDHKKSHYKASVSIEIELDTQKDAQEVIKIAQEKFKEMLRESQLPIKIEEKSHEIDKKEKIK